MAVSIVVTSNGKSIVFAARKYPTVRVRRRCCRLSGFRRYCEGFSGSAENPGLVIPEGTIRNSTLAADVDAVTAQPLRAVEGLVRLLNQIFDRRRAVMGCHTQTAGNRERAGSRHKRRLPDRSEEV